MPQCGYDRNVPCSSLRQKQGTALKISLIGTKESTAALSRVFCMPQAPTPQSTRHRRPRHTKANAPIVTVPGAHSTSPRPSPSHSSKPFSVAPSLPPILTCLPANHNPPPRSTTRPRSLYQSPPEKKIPSGHIVARVDLSHPITTQPHPFHHFRAIFSIWMTSLNPSPLILAR